MNGHFTSGTHDPPKIKRKNYMLSSIKLFCHELKVKHESPQPAQDG